MRLSPEQASRIDFDHAQVTDLHLDPSFPMCWEDPRTLRFGFDRAEARITDPPPAMQRVLARLRTGVRTPHLPQFLRSIGADEETWKNVTHTLAGVLRHRASTQRRTAAIKPALRIGVIGAPEASAGVEIALRQAGHAARRFDPHLSGWDLVIVIERFLELPVIPGAREATGIPQLLIRFSDQSVRVGPIVEALGAPCLTCIALHDVDDEPALPALAAQLLGSRPASETEAIVRASSALALSLIEHWNFGREEPSGPHRKRWRLTVREGLADIAPVPETVTAHPDCGCALSSESTGPPPQ